MLMSFQWILKKKFPVTEIAITSSLVFEGESQVKVKDSVHRGFGEIRAEICLNLLISDLSLLFEAIGRGLSPKALSEERMASGDVWM